MRYFLIFMFYSASVFQNTYAAFPLRISEKQHSVGAIKINKNEVKLLKQTKHFRKSSIFHPENCKELVNLYPIPTEGDHGASLSILFSLLGFFPLPYLGSIIGIICAINALRKNTPHKHSAIFGLILGVLSLIFWVLIAVLKPAA